MKETLRKMNQKRKTTEIYLPILFIVILSAVALRCAAVLLDFNAMSGYFDNKTWITASGIVTAVGCILLFTYAFTAPKDQRLIASFSTPETYIPTGAVCTSLSVFIMQGYAQIRTLNLPFSKLFSLSNMERSTFTLSLIFAAVSIAYFVMTALLTERDSTPRAALGLFAVLFLALYASYLYFDTSLSMNAPNKIVDQMAFLFSAVFFLYEVRISLKREVWNLYIAFGFIAAALTAYSSIPSLVIYFAKGITISNSVYESILSFCIFIFILSRIILASRLNEDRESEITGFIHEYSAERDIAVKESDEKTLNAYIEVFGEDDKTENEYSSVLESKKEALENESIIDEDLVELIATEEPTEKDSDAKEAVDKNENTVEQAKDTSKEEKEGIAPENSERDDDMNEISDEDSQVSDSDSEDGDSLSKDKDVNTETEEVSGVKEDTL